MQPLDDVRIAFDTQSLWLLNLALGLVMFGVALGIRPSDFRLLWKEPLPVLAGVLSQFLLLPALTFILVWFLQPAPSLAMGMLLVAACPGGNVSNFMTQLSGGSAALSVCLTALATLLAVLMTPLNLELWGSAYEPTRELLRQVSVDPKEMFLLVLLLLAVPLAAGMSVRHYRPALAERLAPIFRWASLLFFGLLVFLAVRQNSGLFTTHLQFVFGLVVGHNFLAFGLGFLWGTLMGCRGAQVRAITIETGIQNSGLGLLLVFTFFEGLGGMALLTAFWGIWHLVSGLLLASVLGYFFPLPKNTDL